MSSILRYLLLNVLLIGLLAGCGGDDDTAHGRLGRTEADCRRWSGTRAGPRRQRAAAQSADRGSSTRRYLRSASRLRASVPRGTKTSTGDGTNCRDIDECTAGTDDCHAAATCTNTPGSFTCACNAPAWTGDGKTCSCATGYTAVGDQCLKDNTGPCTTGTECATGNCVGGVCCALPCNTPAACQKQEGTVCVNGTTCRYGKLDDRTVCDDGDACTNNICFDGACTIDTTNPGINCSDNNAVHHRHLRPRARSACVHTPINPAVGCNDNNPCTNDTCSTTAGCQHTDNNTAACTDNNAVHRRPLPDRRLRRHSQGLPQHRLHDRNLHERHLRFHAQERERRLRRRSDRVQRHRQMQRDRRLHRAERRLRAARRVVRGLHRRHCELLQWPALHLQAACRGPAAEPYRQRRLRAGHQRVQRQSAVRRSRPASTRRRTVAPSGDYVCTCPAGYTGNGRGADGLRRHQRVHADQSVRCGHLHQHDAACSLHLHAVPRATGRSRRPVPPVRPACAISRGTYSAIVGHGVHVTRRSSETDHARVIEASPPGGVMVRVLVDPASHGCGQRRHNRPNHPVRRAQPRRSVTRASALPTRSTSRIRSGAGPRSTPDSRPSPAAWSGCVPGGQYIEPEATAVQGITLVNPVGSLAALPAVRRRRRGRPVHVSGRRQRCRPSRHGHQPCDLGRHRRGRLPRYDDAGREPRRRADQRHRSRPADRLHPAFGVPAPGRPPRHVRLHGVAGTRRRDVRSAATAGTPPSRAISSFRGTTITFDAPTNACAIAGTVGGPAAGNKPQTDARFQGCETCSAINFAAVPAADSVRQQRNQLLRLGRTDPVDRFRELHDEEARRNRYRRDAGLGRTPTRRRRRS